MDNRVFCVQESFQYDKEKQRNIPRDLSSAATFGKITTLLSPEDKAGMNPTAVYRKLFSKLHDFNPDTDYLFSSGGDPLNFPLAIAALKELGVNEFNYLRWERDRTNRGQGFYVAVWVKLYAETTTHF